MPIDPASLGAVTSAASSAFGNMMNTMNQNATNFANQAFSNRMYDKQRADALADRDFANHYNSPAEQMKRLKAAGLNVNLAYGSLADAKAENTRSSSPGPTPNQAPQVDFSGIGNAISQFVGITKTMAETDRIREMIDLYKTQQVSNMNNAFKAKADTEAIYQNIKFKDQINPLHLEAMKANITNTDVRSFYMLREDARKELMNSANLTIAFQKVKNMIADQAKTEAQKDEIRKKIDLMTKDGTLKDLDINLKNLGIQPGDELWQRALAQLLDKLFTQGKVTINNVLNPFEGLFKKK